jgi:hypothetical protein
MSGPLFPARFKNVLVESDAQLIHLMRYIHLNPVKAGLVKDPSDWLYSNYREFIKPRGLRIGYCRFYETITRPRGLMSNVVFACKVRRTWRRNFRVENKRNRCVTLFMIPESRRSRGLYCPKPSGGPTKST